MSNGFMGCGSVNAEIEVNEGSICKGQIGVSADWTSSANFVQLAFGAYEGDVRLFVDSDNGDSEELAMALLRAIGRNDLAEQLQRECTRSAEKRAAYERARDKLNTAGEAAMDAFRGATAEQRAAYLAAVTAAEAEFEQATGRQERWYRSVDLSANEQPLASF